jgi:hypothetical protein
VKSTAAALTLFVSLRRLSLSPVATSSCYPSEPLSKATATLSETSPPAPLVGKLVRAPPLFPRTVGAAPQASLWTPHAPLWTPLVSVAGIYWCLWAVATAVARKPTVHTGHCPEQLWAMRRCTSRPRRCCATGPQAEFGPLAFVLFFYFLNIFKTLQTSKICASLV